MQIRFTQHALRRGRASGIRPEDAELVATAGETIESYPDDKPYPSRLVLGWVESDPLHVVVADNAVEEELVVVTVYRPDPSRWDEAFRRRRPTP